MTRHANLYYLFLEDRDKNLIRAEKNQEIRKNIENFYNQLNLEFKFQKNKLEKGMW